MICLREAQGNEVPSFITGFVLKHALDLQTKPKPLTFDTIKETLETKACMYMIPCNQFNHASISEPSYL